MRTSDEMFYLHPESDSDNPQSWNNEAAFFRGLGNAADTMTGSFTTPSGEPAAPQGATQQSQSGGFFQSLASAVQSVLPVAAQAYNVKKLTDLNIERSRSGLAPLSETQYASMIPAAQVRVGPDEQTKKLLMYGALALGGLVALKAFKVI